MRLPLLSALSASPCAPRADLGRKLARPASSSRDQLAAPVMLRRHRTPTGQSNTACISQRSHRMHAAEDSTRFRRITPGAGVRVGSSGRSSLSVFALEGFSIPSGIRHCARAGRVSWARRRRSDGWGSRCLFLRGADRDESAIRQEHIKGGKSGTDGVERVCATGTEVDNLDAPVAALLQPHAFLRAGGP